MPKTERHGFLMALPFILGIGASSLFCMSFPSEWSVRLIALSSATLKQTRQNFAAKMHYALTRGE